MQPTMNSFNRDIHGKKIRKFFKAIHTFSKALTSVLAVNPDEGSLWDKRTNVVFASNRLEFVQRSPAETVIVVMTLSQLSKLAETELHQPAEQASDEHGQPKQADTGILTNSDKNEQDEINQFTEQRLSINNLAYKEIPIFWHVDPCNMMIDHEKKMIIVSNLVYNTEEDIGSISIPFESASFLEYPDSDTEDHEGSERVTIPIDHSQVKKIIKHGLYTIHFDEQGDVCFEKSKATVVPAVSAQDFGLDAVLNEPESADADGKHAEQTKQERIEDEKEVILNPDYLSLVSSFCKDGTAIVLLRDAEGTTARVAEYTGKHREFYCSIVVHEQQEPTRFAKGALTLPTPCEKGALSLPVGDTTDSLRERCANAATALEPSMVESMLQAAYSSGLLSKDGTFKTVATRDLHKYKQS